MIIVKLMGGLGNQLFQYSFGRQVSILNNVELKLDATTGFVNDSYRRSFLLSNFCINAKIASREELQKFISCPVKENNTAKRKMLNNVKEVIRNEKLSSIFLKAKSIYYKHHGIICETRSSFDSSMLRNEYDDAYFQGYWQSEKYFHNIRNILRGELKTDIDIPERFRIIEDEINRYKSIGMHLRRYQYVPGRGVDKAAKRIYAELNGDYYLKAIELMKDHFDAIKLYVFSDDIEWAKNIINTKMAPKFVHTGLELADFKLLRSCKHQIIANSTFSWWAAWLNENEDKMIIAPRKWFKHKSSKLASLYPISWKII